MNRALSAAAPEGSVVRSTLRALLKPTRAAAILIVAAALVAAQGNYSRDPFAVPLGVIMCLLFVLVAPVSFRVLFPDGLEFSHGAIRLLLYGAIGTGVVAAVGVFLPRILGMGHTLLTAPSSVVVCLALFVVGGWGLGRDIGFEARLARAERRSDELRREAERAQLLAVRAHLDPHFLFNTLNAIAEWCRTDGAVAEDAIVRLAGMLRTILAGVRAPSWPLADELALCEALLSMHRLRDPALFVFERDVPSLPPISVPPMLLLPLFENAVTHGPARGHRGPIWLAVRTAGDATTITIESPGPFHGRRPDGQGLSMVERRLALAYGEGAAPLRIEAAGGGTRVELILPARAPREANT